MSGHGGALDALASKRGLRSEDLLDFSSNLNPLGPPACVGDILKQPATWLSRYPDPDARRLREALAAQHGLSAENFLIGNGSSELISLLPRAIPSARTLILEPTFSEYARAAALAGSQVHRSQMAWAEGSPWTPGAVHSAILGAGTLCFLANPNNPTGTVWPREQLLGLIHAYPRTMFVVDEAFVDFLATCGSTTLIREVSIENLVVLRSMTKFWSIPGLRLGYLAAHPRVVRALRRHQEPWSVNGLAQAVGERLLRQGDFASRTARWLQTERPWFIEALRELAGWRVFDTQVNFVLVDVAGAGLTAATLCEALLAKRLVLRDAGNFHGIGKTFVRVAISGRSQNMRLLAGIQEVLQDLVRREPTHV